MVRGPERSWRTVPRSVLAMLAITLALQVGWHTMQPPPKARAEDLNPPPPVRVLRAVAFGDPIFLAYALLLRLQAFDNQPGISIPFKDLDYTSVMKWLDALLQLDPKSQYPLLLASTVYAQVPDADKKRLTLGFVYHKFLEDPLNRWPWLAHATVMAKHSLGDLPLALKYAQAIADHANDPSVPAWARQMHIFLREDIGEYDAAKVLLGGLLDSGSVEDPHEVAFLLQRLEALEKAEKLPVLPKR